MEFKGRVAKTPKLSEGLTKAGKDWASCEFIIEEEGQYPQKAKFKYFGQDDKVKYVKQFSEKAKIGSMVDVKFNIKCNEYNGNDYVELNAYFVALESSSEQTEQFENQNQGNNKEESSDLPF